MNIKQKSIALFGVMTLGLSVIGLAQPAYAAKCGGVDTSIISCSQNNGSGDVKDNGVWGILLIALNILTAGVGVVAVGGLIFAGITYATASNNQNQVTKAKEMIFNVVLGLVLYAFMYSFAQFLIPGGIFKV